MSDRRVSLPTVTLDEISENVRELSAAHGWDQADPTVRMLHLSSEIGEVADALLTLRDAQPDTTDEARTALGHEIFDAIWNLCALADATGIDLEQAARSKMIMNAARTWSRDDRRP